MTMKEINEIVNRLLPDLVEGIKLIIDELSAGDVINVDFRKFLIMLCLSALKN